MLLGVIADDFTGGSDIANTIAKGLPGQGGLRTAQFVRVPTRDAAPDIQAGVISLKTRSIPANEAIRQSLAALAWLRAQGCEQFVFKYCSTFDSTAEGNIGQVAEAIAKALSVEGVVVCPAFPTMGRTIYQGHLFVRDQLLNESGMQHHPLTPMTDPDIRRWLQRQCDGVIGHVPWLAVKAGSGTIASALREAAVQGRSLVVVDAIDDADLLAIGEAAEDSRFLTGGSGIAMGLPRNFISRGKAGGASPATVSMDGSEAIIAGSCSSATRDQIEFHMQSHPGLAVGVDQVMAGSITEDDIISFAMANAGRAPVVYSSATPAEVEAAQVRYGREAVAGRLDRLFAISARQLVANGVKRLVVAGGETSGAVVSALDVDSLVVGMEIDPGVPLLSVTAPVPIALALKSGNFGSRDFFSKALQRMAGR
ncbi:four-carbon acid sugar kinase family protein [Mesorhizobium sp. B2-4-15]|uniref:3-oxo-tetronate kinase n=1 Tax=Mesorhizobium sp. B2-4-15 TaxID=2589934 RepID=UPI001152C1E4|nr:3-oxo-tetronate kinase [Mesorhizobium sp. B2-4-15]TPK62406.1 four-carbon acid sugar kinase family protein [Mesorhizobium sp. B2-4-15]